MLTVAYTCAYVVVRRSSSSIVFSEKKTHTTEEQNVIWSKMASIHRSVTWVNRSDLEYPSGMISSRRRLLNRWGEKKKMTKPSDAILSMYTSLFSTPPQSRFLFISTSQIIRWAIPWKEIYLSIGKQIKYAQTTFAFVIWVSRRREREWKIKKKYC